MVMVMVHVAVLERDRPTSARPELVSSSLPSPFSLLLAHCEWPMAKITLCRFERVMSVEATVSRGGDE